jgi:hypothetical protein
LTGIGEVSLKGRVKSLNLYAVKPVSKPEKGSNALKISIKNTFSNRYLQQISTCPKFQISASMWVPVVKHFFGLHFLLL